MSAFSTLFCVCVSGKRAGRIFGSTENPVYFDFKALLFFLCPEVLKALFNRLRSKNTTSQAYPDGADKLYFSFSASISQGNTELPGCVLRPLQGNLRRFSSTAAVRGSPFLARKQQPEKMAVTTALYTSSAFKTFFGAGVFLCLPCFQCFQCFLCFLCFKTCFHVFMFLCLR